MILRLEHEETLVDLLYYTTTSVALFFLFRSVNNETGITDPYQSDIQVHQRNRRGFWEGLKFLLKSPSVNWQKKLGGPVLGSSFGVIMENYLDLLICMQILLVVFLSDCYTLMSVIHP
jgi:hypothetical protein